MSSVQWLEPSPHWEGNVWIVIDHAFLSFPLATESLLINDDGHGLEMVSFGFQFPKHMNIFSQPMKHGINWLGIVRIDLILLTIYDILLFFVKKELLITPDSWKTIGFSSDYHQASCQLTTGLFSGIPWHVILKSNLWQGQLKNLILMSSFYKNPNLTRQNADSQGYIIGYLNYQSHTW